MFAKKLILDLLREDVGEGDTTSNAVIANGTLAVGEVIANQNGVVAGLREAEWLCMQQGLRAKGLVNDGETVGRGQELLRISGSARKILMVERTVLNLIGRMSGIATMTKQAVKIAGKGIRIAATRKTIWGPLDKEAVKLGGGWPHRWRLDDGIMIKTNHLRFVDVVEAVRKAKKKGNVEVEAGDEKTAIRAAEAGADIVMLDNFGEKEIAETMKKLKKINPKIKIEVSGGVTLENLGKFARFSPEIISLGALTHSAKWFDVSMRVRCIKKG